MRDELSTSEYALAHKRWEGETAALKSAIQRAAVTESDHYLKQLGDAFDKGEHLAMERKLYQIVATHELAKAGELPVTGTGLEVVRAGDHPAGELISEPASVLRAVKEFAQTMNKVRAYCVPLAVDLLAAATTCPIEHRNDAAGNMDELFNEETFARSIRRLRSDTGLGIDGWRGITLRWAPEWMRQAYLGALRSGAVHGFPTIWSEWPVVMIPKRGKDPAVFSKNRDIWLTPHGWKVQTGMAREGYDAMADKHMLPHSSGFRTGRNGAEAVLAVRLLLEIAASIGVGLARAMLDLAGFFMGIPKLFMYAIEHWLAVNSGATASMRSVQDGAVGRVNTAHGMTDCFKVRAGIGQGCNCSPSRAMLQLVPTQLTLARLVPGFPLPTRGIQLLAVLMMGWFADDANFAAQRMTSIMVALDVAWMPRCVTKDGITREGW